jgi:hypothetical protein
MGTLPPPKTKNFPDDSLEKQVYNIVEQYHEYIPIMNDRNRLGFSLYKYVKGEGDDPATLINSTKIKIEGIDEKDLASKISSEIDRLKKN